MEPMTGANADHDAMALPATGRVACSFCAQMIMPAATLCGFCWHKREATAPAKSGEGVRS